MEVEFTTRYSGRPKPDPDTMCESQCEGMGWVPIGQDDDEEPWKTLWKKAHAKALLANKPSEDGYYFVKCPECDGTGKRNG